MGQKKRKVYCGLGGSDIWIKCPSEAVSNEWPERINVMGLLQEGRWVDQWYNTKDSEGQFVRTSPQFRNWVTSDGSRTERNIGISGRARSLSSIRIISLPLGTPHIDLSRVEGSSKHYFNLGCSLAHGRKRLDIQIWRRCG